MIVLSQTPTPQRVRELLDYDPITGAFVWKKKGHGGRRGLLAGTNKDGYITITVDRQTRFAHRLAWTHYYGEIPPSLIDHIDGDGLNNRISNLRLCDSAQNQQNRRFTSLTGLKGVTRLPNGRFQVQIKMNGRQTYLGTFDTAEEAARTYDSHALRAFGPFARANFPTATANDGEAT